MPLLFHSLGFNRRKISELQPAAMVQTKSSWEGQRRQQSPPRAALTPLSQGCREPISAPWQKQRSYSDTEVQNAAISESRSILKTFRSYYQPLPITKIKIQPLIQGTSTCGTTVTGPLNRSKHEVCYTFYSFVRQYVL